MFLSSYFWYKTSYLACAAFLVKTAVFPWFLSKTHTVTNISHIACVNMNSNCVIGGPHISGLHIRTKSDQSHLWSYYPRGACCAQSETWLINPFPVPQLQNREKAMWEDERVSVHFLVTHLPSEVGCMDSLVGLTNMQSDSKKRPLLPLGCMHGRRMELTHVI